MTDCATNYTYEFVRRSLPESCRRVLEIGCGNGALAARLMADGIAVVALDSDPLCVEAAQRRGVDARHAVWPDFADGRFDAVLFTRSLHHVDDLDTGIAQALACLRPGGRLIVEDFDFGFADAATLDWFYGLAKVIRAAGATLEGNAFVSDLMSGDRTPIEAWHAQHDHPLHPAATIEAALRAATPSLAIESAAYFFRYVAGNDPAGDALGEAVRVHELDLITRGAIMPLGRRYTVAV